jgi:hypothetical protein
VTSAPCQGWAQLGVKRGNWSPTLSAVAERAARFPGEECRAAKFTGPAKMDSEAPKGQGAYEGHDTLRCIRRQWPPRYLGSMSAAEHRSAASG